MTKKEIKFRDPVVERVVDKFVSRSDVGFAKYGKTLHDERTGGHNIPMAHFMVMDMNHSRRRSMASISLPV